MNKYLIYFFLIVLTPFSLISQQQWQVDKNDSSIKWNGKKGSVIQFGFVPIESGYFILNEGMIVSGEFIVNMHLLNVQSLENKKSNKLLTSHLRSKDFFSVIQYPQAFLKINNAVIIPSASIGELNYTLSGELTVKGITHAITFQSVVILNDNKLTAKADLVFLRSEYNVTYGLQSMFAGLGDNLINDEVLLNIDLVAIGMK